MKMTETKQEHISVMELGTQSQPMIFRLLKTEPYPTFKTNYDWYLKTKTNGGLMRKNKDNKLEKYDKVKKTWVLEDENQYWYEAEGKRKCYLDQIFTYEAQLDSPKTLTIRKGKKQIAVDKFYMDCSYAQNKLVDAKVKEYSLTKYYKWEKQGKQWFIQLTGDVPKSVLESSVAAPTPSKDAAPTGMSPDVQAQMKAFMEAQNKTVLTGDETQLVAMAKQNNFTAEAFKMFLTAQGKQADRIELMLKSF